MSSMKAVLGLVRNHAQVDAVIGALLNTGFVRSDISTLCSGRPPTGAFVLDRSVQIPTRAVTAGGFGIALGAALGLLAGLGALAIPGLGPFIAAGSIMTAIVSIVAGASIGGIAGALAGLGISEIEARQYQSKLRDGVILLSIHVDDHDQRAHAKKVLEGYGATNIATVGDRYDRYASPALA
jgi:hypothetical protein